jgi:hypothetical protein
MAPIERKVERDPVTTAICSARGVMESRLNFLLIIFQQAVKVIGRSRCRVDHAAGAFFTKGRLFGGLALPRRDRPKRGFAMPELLTAATYLIVWLICWRVIGIESGLTKLIISLGAAIFVFVFLSVKDHHQKKKRGGR